MILSYNIIIIIIYYKLINKYQLEEIKRIIKVGIVKIIRIIEMVMKQLYVEQDILVM